MSTFVDGLIEMSCPNIAGHTKGIPAGYGERAEWAMRMGRTHRQTRCPGCDLYVIWVPKKKRAEA
jgi:hypothetical protein